MSIAAETVYNIRLDKKAKEKLIKEIDNIADDFVFLKQFKELLEKL